MNACRMWDVQAEDDCLLLWVVVDGDGLEAVVERCELSLGPLHLLAAYRDVRGSAR